VLYFQDTGIQWLQYSLKLWHQMSLEHYILQDFNQWKL
jgi:hypothetical protein